MRIDTRTVSLCLIISFLYSLFKSCVSGSWIFVSPLRFLSDFSVSACQIPLEGLTDLTCLYEVRPVNSIAAPCFSAQGSGGWALPVEILAERAVGEAEPLAHLGMRNRLYLVVERLQGDAQHVCRFPGTKVFLLEHLVPLQKRVQLLRNHSCLSPVHGLILLGCE